MTEFFAQGIFPIDLCSIFIIITRLSLREVPRFLFKSRAAGDKWLELRALEVRQLVFFP